MPERPSPEKLLERVKEEERLEHRGKLKIYLGAAPGVGKTYAMLQDALELLDKGLDIVVGVVESHGRAEIEAMLKNLKILPKQSVEYHGKQLLDFDLDAALKRSPALILIDEMAHTNPPGLRHTKRWQDIKELLDRGIDVYTTLNVQHIESLNDDVSQIIHAPIKETVPDSMIEMADTIELVDLPPDDLLKRLHEGKVYIPAQAELAAEHFFRKGNLNALRELALRVTAERVGTEVLLYRQGQRIKHIWPTKEKILVCVGSGSESLKLIRAARRMATNLQAEWIAVYIDTPKLQADGERRYRALQNLRLAEQLGAEVRVLAGSDIVKEIMGFAREQNVTQIMIWKHIRTRWRDLFFGNLADEIVRHSGEIDVYLMTGTREKTTAHQPMISLKKEANWHHYLFATGVIVVATLIDFLLDPYLAASNLIMVYVVAVTIVALVGQMGPSIFASILSVLIYDFFFIPPYYSFATTDFEYLFSLLMMVIVTQIISHLTIISRRQTEIARVMEHQTSALYTLSRRLASTRGMDKLLDIGVKYLSDVFDSEVMALMPKDNHLVVLAKHRTNKTLDSKEESVAQWVYDMGQMAGLGTDTLSFSDALYLPLLGSQGAIGVLRIRPSDNERLFIPEQMRLLTTCTTQLSVALEVDRIHAEANKHELKYEIERVRNKLLKAVSHDLRTPLTAVIGAASTLMETGEGLEPTKVKTIGKEIYFETEQVNRLINNLLQISYLESEIKLHKKSSSLLALVKNVIKDANQSIGKRPTYLNIPPDLPLIPFDSVLLREVFINLIDNANKFTPFESPIEISAHVEKKKVIVSIEDAGPGIMPDEEKKLFDKFYRGRMLTSERGLGLGLAICKRIIQAHHGEIWAENRKDGGAAFRFSLPLE